MNGTFRSLGNYNYRLWAGGALVSNTGTWMQRTAPGLARSDPADHNNATAMGVVMGCSSVRKSCFYP